MSSGVVPSPLAGLRRDVDLWIGLMFLVGGIALLATGLSVAASEWRFAREATKVQGIVFDRDFVPADRGDHRKTVYLILYRYQTLEGEARERSEEVSVERWEALPPGTELDVAFLPGFEPRSEHLGLATSLGFLIPALLGGTFTAFGVWFGVPRLKRAFRLVSVYRSGEAASGEVLEMVGTGVKINRVAMVRMRFRFRDAKGNFHQGETGLLYPEEAAALTPGANGTVRYDASAPDVSVWLG